jgi:hypothetical protein
MRKRYIKILICGLLLLAFSGCSEDQKESNPSQKTKKNNIRKIEKTFVEDVVKSFNNYHIESEKAKNIIEDFFQRKNYKVIWNHKLGYNGMRIYFAVQEHPKVYSGIKRGIMVREDGAIEAVFDLNKGIYRPDKVLLSFKRLGLEGIPECFVLMFKYEQLHFYESKEKRSWGTTIFVPILDENLNNIANPQRPGASTSFFFSLGVAAEKSITERLTYNFDLDFFSEKQYYENERKYIGKYKKWKSKGVTVKFAGVKGYFEKLKKKGLVEGEK